MGQQVLWDILQYCHNFLIINTCICSEHAVKLWAIISSSVLKYENFIAKNGPSWKCSVFKVAHMHYYMNIS